MLIINSYNRIKFSFLNFSFFVTMKIGKFFSKIAFSNNYLKILNNIVNNLYIKGYAIVPNYYTSDEVENLIKGIDFAKKNKPKIYAIIGKKDS